MRFKVQMLVKNNTRRLSRRSDIARKRADVMTDLFREAVGAEHQRLSSARIEMEQV